MPPCLSFFLVPFFLFTLMTTSDIVVKYPRVRRSVTLHILLLFPVGVESVAVDDTIPVANFVGFIRAAKHHHYDY